MKLFLRHDRRYHSKNARPFWHWETSFVPGDIRQGMHIENSQETKRMTLFCKDWHLLELLPFIFLGVFGVRVIQ